MPTYARFRRVTSSPRVGARPIFIYRRHPSSPPKRSQLRNCAMAPAIPRRSASVQLTLISQDEVLPRDAEYVLTAAFTAKDYGDCIKDLDRCKIDPQAFIDGLDRVGSGTTMFMSSTLTVVLHQVIDTLSTSSKTYRRSLRALRKVCGIYGLLPSSYIKPEPLTLVIAGPMKRPFASGGYADVWRASDPSGRIFAVKQLRIYIVDNIEQVKKVPRICHS